jgi:hypothetical protein
VQSSFCTTAVIQSEAVFQAERRISGLTGLERKRNCTITRQRVCRK